MRRNQKIEFFNNFFCFNKIKTKQSDEYQESGKNLSSETQTDSKEEIINTLDLSSMFNSLKQNIIENYKLLNKTSTASSSFSSLIDDFEQSFYKLQANMTVINNSVPVHQPKSKIKTSTKNKKANKKSEITFEVKPNKLSGAEFIDKNIEDYKFDFVKISGEKENAVLIYREKWQGEDLTLEYKNNEYILKSLNNIVETSNDKEELLKNFYKNIKTMNTFDKAENIGGRVQIVKCYDRRPIKFSDVYTWFSFYEGSPITTCCDCGVTSETDDYDDYGDELCKYCESVKY